MRGRDLRAMREQAKVNQEPVRAAMRIATRRIVDIERERVVPTPEEETAYILAVDALKNRSEADKAVA